MEHDEPDAPHVEESAYSVRPRIRSYRDLIVWQRSMDLTVRIHEVARLLPSCERHELARDLRRSARSIPSNIAEGFGRFSRASYRWHISIALGSQAELETQVEIAHRLGYVGNDAAREALDQIAEVGRLLHGLRRALGKRSG